MVSLILTTFNCKENLRKTLESIEKQDYSDLEVVIKDEGSSDGTVTVIKEYEKNSRFTVKWTSMTDNGLYDAMNQGLSLATGEIIFFFHDIFAQNDVISKCIQRVEQEGTAGVYGDIAYIEDGMVKQYWKTGTGKIRNGWLPDCTTLFLRREIYERYGNYDNTCKDFAGFEFMVRMLKDGQVKLSYIPETLVEVHYMGTGSRRTGIYVRSIKRMYGALVSNRIRFAWWIILLYIVRTMPQFRAKPKVDK